MPRRILGDVGWWMERPDAIDAIDVECHKDVVLHVACVARDFWSKTWIQCRLEDTESILTSCVSVQQWHQCLQLCRLSLASTCADCEANDMLNLQVLPTLVLPLLSCRSVPSHQKRQRIPWFWFVASGHVFPCRRPLWIQRTSCTSLIFGVVAITPSVARDPPIPWSPFAWKIVVWTRDDEGNNSWRNGWPVQRRFLDCSKLWALKLQPPRRSGFLIPSSIMKDGAWFALDRSNQKISFLWHDHDSPWQLMLADLGQGLCSFAAHVSSAFWCQGWPK